MAQMPKFNPPETPKANYDQGAVSWAYIILKYATPKGPEQKNYDPYYSYMVGVYIGDQYINHRWFPSVDEHKLIQMAGATKDSQLAVTYVKEDKRKGLVVMHSGGPNVVRQQAQVDTETEAALLKMARGQGNSPLPPVVLPPAPPVIAPPSTAPAPPTQQPPQQQQQVVVPPTPPPPQPPKPRPAQPARQAPEEPSQRVYHPRFVGDFTEANLALFSAISRDAVEIRYMAYLDAEVRFEDKLPKIPTKKSLNFDEKLRVAEIQLRRAELLVQLSSAPNMTLSKETYHKLEKEGVTWVLGKRPEPALEPTTMENAITLTKMLDPESYAEPVKHLIKDWLGYVAGPHEHINSWKHAANICKILGLSTEVIISDFDMEHLVRLTKAIWAYEDHKQDGMSRDDALRKVSEDFGLPSELMDFEEENEDE